MTTYKEFTQAENAASEFFITNFGHSGEVSHIRLSSGEYEFTSCDDPAMDDTFNCLIED